MFGLAHVDLMPLIYGFVIFIGLWSMWAKLINGMFLALAIEASVFWLVFTLHGGSMAGGFSAAFAALLAGFIFPRSFRRRS
jgi:membrane protein YdbS with pleckstrin-like domain